jgi:hypothetical protein
VSRELSSIRPSAVTCSTRSQWQAWLLHRTVPICRTALLPDLVTILPVTGYDSPAGTGFITTRFQVKMVLLIVVINQVLAIVPPLYNCTPNGIRSAVCLLHRTTGSITCHSIIRAPHGAVSVPHFPPVELSHRPSREERKNALISRIPGRSCFPHHLTGPQLLSI